MEKAKEFEIKRYLTRSDYQQILHVKNYDNSEIDRIVLREYSQK
jgi:hypothetical protein